ncbi:MAG TPA: hypothetical protein VHF07_08810 [Nitrospiraceae bacterium]|nr:hypothetical protein [Nitrospiraceae bacterium]
MTRIGIALGAALLVATYASAGMAKEAHPLKAATGSKAEVHINEGIAHYEKGSLGHRDQAFPGGRERRSQVR